jgi:hypothetical protein
VDLSGVLETVVASVRRVEGFEHLEVFESLLQEVRARVFWKIESWGKFRRI